MTDAGNIGTILGSILGPSGFAWVAVKMALNGTKADIKEIKGDMKEVRKDLFGVRDRVSRLEGELK